MARSLSAPGVGPDAGRTVNAASSLVREPSERPRRLAGPRGERHHGIRRAALGPRAGPEGPSSMSSAGVVVPLGWQPPTWDDVVEHRSLVYRLAYRLTGNPQDAEDLTQDVFVRVFRSLSSYRPGSFEGWLHRITTNLFLDGVRRRARQRTQPWLDEDAAERVADAEPDPRPAARRRSPGRRRPGGARRACPGLSRGGAALRRRGPDVRRSRRGARESSWAPSAAASTEDGGRCGKHWRTVPRSSVESAPRTLTFCTTDDERRGRR